MKKISIVCLLVGINLASSWAQIQPDQVWLVGNNDLPGRPGYGNAIIRFLPGGVEIEERQLNMNFESTVAGMVGTNGQLLFYTNGCYIADALGDTMQNGGGLNPGEMADWTCPEVGYAAPFGAMALPMPGSQRYYFLFHMGVRYSPERRLSYGPFYYTLIDMTLNGGLGGVVSRNNILLDGKLEPFACVRHGNGRDWWLVVPENTTSRYHKWMLGPQGIQPEEAQDIGTSPACTYIGSSTFAPNGMRYARLQNCGAVVMDFDRCSGNFSAEKYLPLPPNAFAGGGVAFSSNGNKLLVTTQLSIQAADLNAPNPVLDTVVNSIDARGVSLSLMQYAPDGNLYISNLGRKKSLHVVENPDDEIIGFSVNGFQLPVFAVRTLPNSPNYRLLDAVDQVCDTLGINTLSLEAHPDQRSITVFPNPAYDRIWLDVNAEVSNPIVYDLLGRKMADCADWNGKSCTVKNLSPGVYYLSFSLEGRTVSRLFVRG